MRRFLVRADDLGYSEGTNYGIAKSIQDGIIRSVGVMTNMPLAAHGLQLIKGMNVCFGQHTNICTGKPLTDPMRIPSIVQNNGEFKTSKEYRIAEKDFVVLDEVIIEIEAQYQRFLELVGEEPHYFEGHAVRSENFYKGLKIVAENHGLKYLQLNTDQTPMRFGNTWLYTKFDGMKPDYNPFQTMKDIEAITPEDACSMMVCHPGYVDAYILEHSSMTVNRTLDVEFACSPDTRTWLTERNIQLVTYDEL